jgi:hypothetical protein
MSGRRSHPRFDITPSSDGVLTVLRDVTVQHAEENELLVIGREAGVIGDDLTLEVTDAESTLRSDVRVIESLPIIVNGAVRHRLRLRRMHGASPASFQQGRRTQERS